jgi:flagellar protein FlbT
MALKVELKAGERFILGDCLVINSAQRIQLLIGGDAPILREKDIMTVEQANTPAKRIYFAIQSMYTAHDPIPYHETYFDLMRDLLQAAPSTWPHILTINNHILAGEMYKALKSAQNLIAYEETLVAPAGAPRPVAATGFSRADDNLDRSADYRGDRQTRFRAGSIAGH